MANWKEPKNDYKPEDQVVPEIFNTLAENERYLQEKKITTEQVQDATINSTQSASRENLGDKETVKGFFGKIRKWFADLRALAFKGTVGTNDIDNLAVTSAKIGTGAVTSTKLGSSAVTTAKIASNAVETAKIKDAAVTDAKINSVSASKVTGLHKVATSGSYNDLTDKPSISGGGDAPKVVFQGNANHYDYDLGFNIKSGYRYAVELDYAIGEGIAIGTGEDVTLRVCIPGYCYAADSVMNLSIICITMSYGRANYEGGGKFYIEGCANFEEGNWSGYGYVDIDGHGCPAIKRVIELGKVFDVTSNTPQKTWQLLTNDNFQVQAGEGDKSTTVYIPGLKKGDIVKFTALSVKVNEDIYNECYFSNSPDGNMVYGFTYDGCAYNTNGEHSGWYQHQNEYDYPMGAELELSSETPYVGKVGMIDYSTANSMTIKVSCKQDNQLTIEWTDTAGMYIEMMPIYNIYVKR